MIAAIQGVRTKSDRNGNSRTMTMLYFLSPDPNAAESCLVFDEANHRDAARKAAGVLGVPVRELEDVIVAPAEYRRLQKRSWNR